MIMLRNSIVLYCAAIWLVACSDSVPIQGTPVAQRLLARIDAMQSLPQPLEIIDCHALAQAYDSTVYDFVTMVAHWPLVWWDSMRRSEGRWVGKGVVWTCWSRWWQNNN